MSNGPTGEIKLKLERDWGSHVNKDDEKRNMRTKKRTAK